MKKFLSLILALTFILSCILIMPSCDDDNDTDKPADTGDQNSGAPTRPLAPDEIIKDNVAQYTIVYPDGAPSELQGAANKLASTIQAATGVTLVCESDTVAYERNDNHILIGSTIFPESASAAEELEQNEDAYTIKKVDMHFVLTGRFDGATIAAVDHFCAELIEGNYDAVTKTLKIKEYTNDGEIAIPDKFEFTDLSKYTIIYDPTIVDYQRAAARIRYDIELKTGIHLETVKCTEKLSSPYEILIGETNRPLSQDSYSRGTKLMEYKTVVKNGQLQIVCGGAFSGRMCGVELAESIADDPSGSLKEGTHNRVDLTTETREITEGADVRIMSANVLVEYGRREYPSIERAEIFAKILVDYTPDIIGCQEMASNYHASLLRFFEIIKEEHGIEYSMILEKYEGSANHAPIIYRSDKFKVDYQKFTQPSYQNYPINGQYESGISAAKFTSIADPTLEIAMVTSHWHWEKENEVVGIPKQLREADDMASIVLELRSQFPNAHIFCTGDFNSHRFEGKYFNQFVSNINGEIASTIAKENRVFEDSFTHQGKLIDHIVGKAGTFDVLLHAPTKNYTHIMTDHDPIFADIKFK